MTARGGLTKINAIGRRCAQTNPNAKAANMSVVEIKYFSDILCVWAYISQARIDAIKEKFGEGVRIEHRFCSVFGDTAAKIDTAWKEKGGYAGFNAHLRAAAVKFPHIEVHPDLWLATKPATSMSAHLFLKALQLGERDTATREQRPGLFDRAMWAFRRAFFKECRDISRFDVQREVAAALGADVGAVEERIHSGAAFAALAADYQEADKLRIEGSPSLVLNQGRQKLYGNVGFWLIEANVQGLMRTPAGDDASWC
jgi:predicted DsbA family dithiol-disulfide isomerase